MERIFGWITPSLEYIACRPWSHFQTIKEHPVLREFVPNLDELEEEVEDIYEACQTLSDEEGNCCGEWHRYEIANDDAQQECIEAIYKAGCIRVAEEGRQLFGEGVKKAWTPNMMRFAKQFAEEHGYELVVEIAEWVK